MMRCPATIGVVLFTVVVSQSGCAGHSVRFSPILRCKIPPTDHATAISGNIDEAKALWEKAALPHNGIRQKYELYIQGCKTLYDQLGSDDYLLIGEVFGGGNAWSNHATLVNAFCRKAARKGGDVVLIFRRGMTHQPYSYTTPGYSTTNVNVSAHGYGNYATGYGTSNTTYFPGQTYSGVYHKPNANGFVFKHLPGAAARREAMMSLNDNALARLDSLRRSLAQERKLSLADLLGRVDRAIADESNPRD